MRHRTSVCFTGNGMVSNELKNKGKMLSTDHCIKMLNPP